MLSPIHSLLTVLAHATDRELARQVQYLKIENRILRDKLPKRIEVTPRKRARLLRFGKPLAMRSQAVPPQVAVKGLRPRSPNMNAFVERWIQSIQVERLDHFVLLGEAHLNHLVAEYVEHYHAERPHQGLDNALVINTKPPDGSVPGLREVVCCERLGRLLKRYMRRAP